MTFSALPPLPSPRPLLLVGHGTRDPEGRQAFLDFAQAYAALDASRPVLPCFLELTQPLIAEKLEACLAAGLTDLSVIPLLLFAARHNKFDITSELDRVRQIHPQLTYHYGRHLGLSPEILDFWRGRLTNLDQPPHNPNAIPPSETLVLVVGRGSSDPDANSDVYKLARLLWEGSGYLNTEVCFIGITHPRLEEGFRRARLYQPRRIIVLPHFLFTGVLVQKIQVQAALEQSQHPEILIQCLPEMGPDPVLFDLLRQRELETHLGQVQMNCELCKFRRQATQVLAGHTHGHTHNHDHGHDHHPDHGHEHHTHSATPESSHNGHSHGAHSHTHPTSDPYADLTAYHQRIWQLP